MFFTDRFDLRQHALKWLLVFSAGITGISPCLAQTQTDAPPDGDVAAQQPATQTGKTEQSQPVVMPTKSKSVVIDSIAAVVNKDVITVSELNDRTRVVINQLKSQNIEIPPEDLLRKQILERMIIESAQVQLARDMGINVTDVQLDKSIAMMAQGEGKTMSQFQEMIEKKGRSFEAFREDLRKEITMQRLRYHEVDSKIQINDAEIDNLVGAADAAQPQAIAEVRLGHILIRVPENPTPEQLAEKRERAEKVLKLLQSGGDFQKNAASFSDADEGLSGGDIGWRSIDRLPQAFAEALAQVPVGGLTGVIQSPNGFHILKVLERRAPAGSETPAASANTVQQIHARHILIKVNQLVSADEAKHKLVDLKQRIINNAATFEELAKTYSNDTSASRGGDLGWIYPGDTVPEFEKAMMALNIGEISDPVETQFGYHLIQVLEKKTDDVSQERKRAAAKQKIRERKVVEETGEWLRQLRDQVYVEYHLENNEQ